MSMCFPILKDLFCSGGRGKELKPTRIIKSLASQASTLKKTESVTSLATSKLRSKTCIGSSIKERIATIGFSSRSNERVEKRKEVHK